MQEIFESIHDDSFVNVSDLNGCGNPEFRASELQDLQKGDSFAKKTDVYAFGVILQKMVDDLKVSHQLTEAIKIATDEIEGRATFSSLRRILLDCQQQLATNSEELINEIREGNI